MSPEHAYGWSDILKFPHLYRRLLPKADASEFDRDDHSPTPAMVHFPFITSEDIRSSAALYHTRALATRLLDALLP